MIELILGGARSGKSALAESKAMASGRDVLYIATGIAFDEEMAARIAHHQDSRPAHWQTLECPVLLAEGLNKHGKDGQLILLDCLSLWLNNCLFDEAQDWPAQKSAFLKALGQIKGDIIMVSNEVGQGIIPMGELTRRYVDEMGRLHQDIAAIAGSVSFVTAGLEQKLK